MKPSRVVPGAALAGACLAFASAAFAQVPPVPSPATVEALCPGGQGNPLQFGTAEGQVDPALLGSAKQNARRAGFEKVEPQFTTWSDKLLGVELIHDVRDGAPLDLWGDDFHDQMTAAGWAVSEDSFMPGAQARYEKEIADLAEPGVLAIEVSLHGIRRGITLLCADAALQMKNQEELDGYLGEGSPRPVAPPALPPLDEFMARLDCDDPATLDAFAEALTLEDAGALVETRLAPEDITAQAGYQYRLVQWLRWRMLQSGEIDESVLWDIEEKVREEHPIYFEEDLAMMGEIASGITDAETAKDPARLCESYKSMVRYLAGQSAHEERRNAALAAAYEAEAVRRGIALD